MSILLTPGMSAPMSKHTPGPWDVSHVGHSQPLPCDFRVHTESGATRDEWEANAALIAAAPDLLAALKAAIACIPINQDKTVHEQARAAIAKAEGGS